MTEPHGAPRGRASLASRAAKRRCALPRSDPAPTSSPSRRSPIAHERAEILRLITSLAAVRLARAEAERARVGRSSIPARGLADEKLVPVTLQALETRVRRIEEQIAAKRRSNLPGALPGPSTDAAKEEPIFSGIVQGQMLSDMLQLVSSNNMSGVFTVTNETGACVLHFEEGRIVHGEGPGLSGEAAFFAAFGFETGSYSFRESSEPAPKRTIDSGTQFLILEALRRIDEQRA